MTTVDIGLMWLECKADAVGMYFMISVDLEFRDEVFMTTVDLELMWLKCSITVDLELMVMKSLMTADGVEALIEHPLVGLYILCNLKRKHQKTRMRLSRFVTNTIVILREYVWSHPYMVYRPLRHADNDPPPPPTPTPENGTCCTVPRQLISQKDPSSTYDFSGDLFYAITVWCWEDNTELEHKTLQISAVTCT